MRFGVGLPTCTEGMMYPVPFASPAEVIRIAREAEALGYFAVMGNDHMTTQRYVRAEFPSPPNFYEPLVTYGAVATATSRIKLMTGVIVLPLRHPVVLAKQVATLDQFSGGRVILGVGVGAYREEFEALFPGFGGARRGEMVSEGVQALRLLFSERRASFRGRYVRFEDVEMFPKPRQTPLPIYIGGNAPEGLRRVAAHGDGWLPALLTPEEIRRGLQEIRDHARALGRDVAALDVAPQFVVSIAPTVEEATEKFLRSQLYKHLLSLQRSTLRGQTVESFQERNLLGSPEVIRRRIRAYAQAGVTHLSGLLFVANTVAEFVDSMRLFAEDVMPEFAG
ncbi:MAG: TIGR03619 family F420-dependent LLM class oxidoreductase [Armatimonadota bacterium]|nr:TIGR03619 family F420-dependent LLM class oxidoreductase [Armatimonadota bacterium]MDR7494087.1 TIGR03619 family F420-dependent LLM class oxidoreductase [Armatimonadota bacterium]MDR7498946.1 TIGR03619 family F420-dependent LLM class oxidoreductase [Armatimonadota bacterium]MDR7547993.1 TIGR03619 family F420-dependent LLM class oxidoreductase [Armatimonadota bacterium]MDR7558652.1 TIGR03619 family F420-dependent LLM class oxidoreductase [Armatimonadota bacterium]